MSNAETGTLERVKDRCRLRQARMQSNGHEIEMRGNEKEEAGAKHVQAKTGRTDIEGASARARACPVATSAASQPIIIDPLNQLSFRNN